MVPATAWSEQPRRPYCSPKPACADTRCLSSGRHLFECSGTLSMCLLRHSAKTGSFLIHAQAPCVRRCSAGYGAGGRGGAARPEANRHPSGEPSALPLCYHRKAERVWRIYVTSSLKERACRVGFLQRLDIGRSNLRSPEGFSLNLRKPLYAIHDQAELDHASG